MSSSLVQNNVSSPPIPPSSASSGRPVLTVEGQHTLSQLEHAATQGRMVSRTGGTPTVKQALAIAQLGAANMFSPLGHHAVINANNGSAHQHHQGSSAESVSADHSAKSSVKKSIFRSWKKDHSNKDTKPYLPADNVPTLTSFVQRTSITTPEANTIPAALDPQSPILTVQAAVIPTGTPVVSLLPDDVTVGSLRLEIFSANNARHALSANLPKSCARFDSTQQLVYSCSVLAKAHGPSPPVSDSDDIQVLPLTDNQREWVQQVDPIEQDRLHCLIEQLVKAFVEDQLKLSAAVEEIVLVGPVLDRELYRSLLNCFISKFEETTALDVILLQGLVQLVECASPGYLVGDDLVRIANVLSRELSITHNGTSDHLLYLTLSLARVLDVMVAGKVKDLNRDRDHQPILQLLDSLKDSEDVVQRYEVNYAYQALQYAPDNETPLQVLLRFAKLAAASAGAVLSVVKLEPEALLKGIATLQKTAAEVVGAVSTGIEVVETLRFGAEGVVRASETTFDYMKKRSWYLALQGASLFIRQGRLSDFNLVVSQAPCRHDAHFQWGICRQLGEIAVDPLWDLLVRQQAVDFLGELYKSDAYWKPHADVKQWILTILAHISEMSEISLKNHAFPLLTDLKKDGTAMLEGSYPLSTHLPLPIAFPLLFRVQGIQMVKYDLHRLKLQRISEYKQPVYIAPMAKPSLQAPEDTLFLLMEKVREFLAGDSQVMLILGDSGAGKSTFNRHLEHELWQDYNPGDRIPLFINLPSLERPEKDLVAEHLKLHNFLDDQIRELKLHHKFTLICDGYDESQLKTNLHHTNSLNQYGQWDTKLLVTCRTQYLGPDYRSRFAPMGLNQYARVTNHLFQEAIIAPFTKEQIEDYVARYIPLEPRTWVKEDFMNKMETIPNLMHLVRNPFLLTLCLEVLPNVIEGKSDLSRHRITRVQLYDTFVQHWLGVNKRRLQDNQLNVDDQIAFEELLEDGFERNGVRFQQDLAAAIFKEQGGRPIVDYTQRRDKGSWKAQFFGTDPDISLLRGASLLSRVGTRHRFVHRSILEYFYSCTIYGPVNSNDEFSPHSPFDSNSIGDHPLSQRNLVVEPSIIQFLAERVELEPEFNQQLLALIEQSKTDDRAACAATNAITVLVEAGVRFNNGDLRGIRVPGADLSGGQFDSAQLQEADLTGANLTGSWIRQADLGKARMEEVTFGELPYLEELESVTSIAYSVDGGSFAVGLKDGNINIYSTGNWTKTRTLEGHILPVSGIVYSPSGEQLLSGGHDCTVRLWSCKMGSSEYIMKGHTDDVNAVAFSPAGNQVASASSDRTVRLWDSRTGTVLFVLRGHIDDINSIAYSPDGKRIVSGSTDSTLRIFDTQSGQMDLVLKTTEAVCCVAYSPDGLWIIAGDEDGDLQLWESATGEPVKRLKGNSGRICAVGFSPDCQWIASSSDHHTVTLWETRLLVHVSVFVGHSGLVRSLTFSPNSLQLASGSWDGTVRLWDVTTAGTELSLVVNQSNWIWSVAYSPDGRSLISGDRSGTVRQYDVATGESAPLYSCGFAVEAIVVSPDGRQIAVAGQSEDIRTWRVDAGVEDYVLEGHIGWVKTLAYSPDGQWIASGSADTTVRLWNACTGESGLISWEHGATVLTVAFSPCGLKVVSGSEDGTIQVWNVDSDESRVAVDIGYSIECVTIRYSPIGMQIALQRRWSDCVELWHEESLEPLDNLQHDDQVGIISWSPCGQWIATCSNGSLWLWNLVVRDGAQEWEPASMIRDIFKTSLSIGWRSDALEFVTCGLTGSVQAWKLVENLDGGWSVRLMWSSGRAAFNATDATIVDVIGLSVINRRLLEQRGARDESL